MSEGAPLHHRNIAEARRAFSFSEENHEDTARQLSRAAHSMLSAKPQGALASAGWSEGGHNEEMTHRGATLMLRGGVDGLVLSVTLLSLGNSAEWPASHTLTVSLAVVACWAVFSACREALDSITYQAHYARERSREAWGASAPPLQEIVRPAPL